MKEKHPTEQKVRVDAFRKDLRDKGIYDPVNERFTSEHYDKFMKTFFPNRGFYNDVQELIKLYDKDTIMEMMNSFVQNCKF